MTRPTTRIRLLAVLFSALMVTSLFAVTAVAAPESENNDTLAQADALVLNEVTTGTLADGSDVDLFTFSAQRGQHLTLESTRATSEAGSHRVTVYEVIDGSFGFFTRKADVVVSAGSTRQAGDTIERSGTYVAQAYQGTGDYEFTVSLTTLADAANEPNEGLADATPYTPGTTVSAPLARGDVDVYTFDATRGQELSASMTVPTTGTSSIRLTVYEVVDGSFGFSTRKADVVVSPGTTRQAGDTIERSGTYVAQVYQGTGDYEFTVDLTDLGPDEPNDVLADATPITPGEAVSRELSRGDVDLYTFDATRGQELTASLSLATAAPGGARLSVYEVVDGSFGFSTRKIDVLPSPGQTATGGATIQRSGTYVARVYQGAAGVNYTLELGLRTLRNEPNDVLADATPYDPGVEESAELTTGDVDLYTFDATRGDQINVSVSVPTVETNGVRLSVYEVVDGSFGFSTRKVDLLPSPGQTLTGGDTVERSGQYLIQVTGGPANFTFTLTAARQEFTEPNERTADATDLLPNPKAGAILGPGDVDYYAFEADVGDTVVVEAATATTRTGSLRVQAYDDASGSLGTERVDVSLSAGDAVSGEFVAPRSGTYYVVASGGAGAYDLSVTVDGDVVGVPNDRFERNENANQAPDLALGAYQDLRIVDTDVDVFAVDLAAGDELNAAAALEAAGTDDLTIEVTDDANAVLATGTSVATGAEVVYVAPADGTYYVRVTGAGDATAGYDLTLRVPLSVSLSLGPQRSSARPNETVTVEVSLAGADLNVSAYAFDLAVDPAVATITDVEALGSNLLVDATVAPDGASASVNVVANETLASTGLTPLVRVTLTTGAADGESALTFTNASVVDGTGGAYATSTVDGAVVVSTGPGNVGGGASAGDLDGDGLFEDVDGDGDADFFDVVTLLFAIDRIDEDGLGEFFDFDGRGGFTFLDVVDLLFRL